MDKFEDSAGPNWTEDVRTRDYYPTRFEYFLKDVLTGMLSRTAPKDEDKCIRNAIRYTKLIEEALDAVDSAQD